MCRFSATIKPVGEKILNKILENHFKKHNKKIVRHDHLGLIPGMQGWYNISNELMQHISSIKDKNHILISIEAIKIIHSC